MNLIWSDHIARFRANLIILDVSDLVWLLTARRVIGKVVEEFIFNLLAELFGLFIGIVTFLLVSTESTISSEVRPFNVAKNLLDGVLTDGFLAVTCSRAHGGHCFMLERALKAAFESGLDHHAVTIFDRVYEGSVVNLGLGAAV